MRWCSRYPVAARSGERGGGRREEGRRGGRPSVEMSFNNFQAPISSVEIVIDFEFTANGVSNRVVVSAIGRVRESPLESKKSKTKLKRRRK